MQADRPLEAVRFGVAAAVENAAQLRCAKLNPTAVRDRESKLAV